jgi:hypothetical protein
MITPTVRAILAINFGWKNGHEEICRAHTHRAKITSC